MVHLLTELKSKKIMEIIITINSTIRKVKYKTIGK